MEVFREFKSVGLRGDVVLYSTLIDALCKSGLVGSAVSLIDEMTKEGISPNVVTYNSIIDAFGRSATMESRDELVKTYSAAVWQAWSIPFPLSITAIGGAPCLFSHQNLYPLSSLFQTYWLVITSKRPSLAAIRQPSFLDLSINVTSGSRITNSFRYFSP
ncbi:hypothetical protein F2Q69_00011636 [Brassica cretica]|uniref:Pentacotripeptide-repeat region of PRORP domain-containing protein n=1 Tax=Brassica cretica TaxID=69181 RepID=A0A8S9R2Y3_BRACR|nr:hypothetical protein F2Q69_00011636 [Brassica cretica]